MRWSDPHAAWESCDRSDALTRKFSTYAGHVPDTLTEHPLAPRIRAALHGVNDPEIRRPITDLGMVEAIEVDADNRVRIEVLLTVSGCPGWPRSRSTSA